METWLKNSLEGHESPIPIGGWKGLHQTRKRKNRLAYYWFLAASVILFAGMSIWQFGGLSPESSPQAGLDTKSGQYPTINENLPSGIRPGSTSSIPDADTQSDETTFVRPVRPLLQPVMPNPANHPTEEPIISPGRTEALSIRSIKPVEIAIETGTLSPLMKRKDIELRPRKRVGWTFFAEAAMGYGKLDFDPGRNAKEIEYRAIVEKSDFIYREYTIGLGAYRQLSTHWSLGTAIQLVKSSMEGILDYTQSVSGIDPATVNNWQTNPTLKENNFRYAPDIHTWGLRTPLRLRYQLFEGNSPLLELGGNYTYSLASSGNWLDPESLEPRERQKNLATIHQLSPELGLGYQHKLGQTSVAVWYRYNPQTRPYKPAGGSLETTKHTFSIQWQMSH